MTPGTRDGLCHSLVRARARAGATATVRGWGGRHPRRGPALAPAVGARPRPLAGRRGVAAPGLDGVLPARRRRAAPAGRRGAPRPADPRGDAGARRPARLPRRAARRAGVDGRLVAAGAGGGAAARAGDARPRGGAVPRGRRGAATRWPVRGGRAAARCCATSPTAAWWSSSAARRPTPSSRCSTTPWPGWPCRPASTTRAGAPAAPRSGCGRPSAATAPAWSGCSRGSGCATRCTTRRRCSRPDARSVPAGGCRGRRWSRRRATSR